MSRSFAVGLVALAGVVTAVPTPPVARGCAVAPPPGGRIDVSSETALIVYDPETKTEHFLRTAAFNTALAGSADFGFLVPTPGKPELAEASPDVFAALAAVTKPRTVVERKARQPDFGCGMLLMSKSAEVGEAAPALGSAVRVVDRKRVGAFDAAVLKADDPRALRGWLEENGYEARLQLEQWFEAYTANKWYLTAFKVATETGGPTPPGGAKTVTNSAVRISFPTDTPFYPYREPVDARTATAGGGASRTLRVFVLTDSRVTGRIGKGDPNAPFPGRTVWANSLDAGRLTAVTTAGKLPALPGNRHWHLTEFEDRSSPRPGTDEVYFSPSADQSAVERPPLVGYEYYDAPVWPWVSAAVGAPVLVAGLIVWRVLRRKG